MDDGERKKNDMMEKKKKEKRKKTTKLYDMACVCVRVSEKKSLYRFALATQTRPGCIRRVTAYRSFGEPGFRHKR